MSSLYRTVTNESQDSQRTKINRASRHAMAVPQTNTWSHVLVRSHSDGQPQGFNILPIGCYCALCDKCKHCSIVSPNIQHALLCTHCDEVLHLPLEAHFTCPATLRRQFAVMEPFDIMQFLASQAYELRDERNSDDEVVALVGFMDIAVKQFPQCNVCQEVYSPDYTFNEKSTCACGSRVANVSKNKNNNIWSTLSKFWHSSFNSSTTKPGTMQSLSPKQRVLAVVAGGSLSCYVVKYNGDDKRHHERICHMSLEDARFELTPSGTGILGDGFGMRVEMDLGSKDIAKMWFSVLVNRVQAIDRQRQCDLEHVVAAAAAVTPYDSGIDSDSELDCDGYCSTDRDSATALRLIPI
ncbi:hypothetical protein LPJ73_005762 [Coemansia sp. RSA 2703]|nr:hypothetical protein LPJ73_005762 [Coemansia sp. RSA 2703]KAJ2387728.1 hypothetical protein GGI05_004001 [Coemansia sp. RSA 2603]